MMKHIFLDFDRTLFATDRFYNELERRAVCAGSIEKELDFAAFLYPDLIPFLQSCQNVGWRCYLLTFGARVVQEPKFLACGIEQYFTETFYVESGPKAAVIKKAIENSVPHENIYLIDDTMSHLEAFNTEFPKSKAIKMSRIGAKGSEVKDFRFKNVVDLDELLSSISSKY